MALLFSHTPLDNPQHEVTITAYTDDAPSPDKSPLTPNEAKRQMSQLYGAAQAAFASDPAIQVNYHHDSRASGVAGMPCVKVRLALDPKDASSQLNNVHETLQALHLGVEEAHRAAQPAKTGFWARMVQGGSGERVR